MEEHIISFIIPAYNEEKNIVNTLKMIKQHVPPHQIYELILVDHGSIDGTCKLAKQYGAKVYEHPEGTIAALRNYGVSKAIGDILVFIDADISLTFEWENHIEEVISVLRSGEKILTGSWYCVPEKPNWIEKYWFEPLQKINNTHINSGHMIISRALFHSLGGFTDKLETGEDYDISMRAKAQGIQVVDNHALKVIHEGYPNSLWEYIQREYWHGKGDASTIGAIIQSKVALIALIFVLLHLALISAFILFSNVSLIFILLLIVVLIIFGASFKKYKQETIGVISINMFLYYCYFWARATSLITAIFRRRMKKRQR